MNTTKEQTQFAAAVFVYEDDGWYGKNIDISLMDSIQRVTLKRHSVE